MNAAALSRQPIDLDDPHGASAGSMPLLQRGVPARSRRRLDHWAISKAVRALLYLTARTAHETIHGDSWLRERLDRPPAARQPVILACWHNQLLGATRFAERQIVDRGAEVCPVASHSKDGDLIVRILADIKPSLRVIRGSSKRGGASVMRGMQQALAEGASVIVTVDGPRGPRYEAKPGVIRLAIQTGVPILPIAWSASRRVEVRSTWDAHRIPLPGARTRFLVGPPLAIPIDAPLHALPFWLARLDDRLAALTRLADRFPARIWRIGRDRGTEKASTYDAWLAAQQQASLAAASHHAGAPDNPDQTQSLAPTGPV